MVCYKCKREFAQRTFASVNELTFRLLHHQHCTTAKRMQPSLHYAEQSWDEKQNEIFTFRLFTFLLFAFPIFTLQIFPFLIFPFLFLTFFFSHFFYSLHFLFSPDVCDLYAIVSLISKIYLELLARKKRKGFLCIGPGVVAHGEGCIVSIMLFFLHSFCPAFFGIASVELLLFLFRFASVVFFFLHCFCCIASIMLLSSIAFVAMFLSCCIASVELFFC